MSGIRRAIPDDYCYYCVLFSTNCIDIHYLNYSFPHFGDNDYCGDWPVLLPVTDAGRAWLIDGSVLPYYFFCGRLTGWYLCDGDIADTGIYLVTVFWWPIIDVLMTEENQ